MKKQSFSILAFALIALSTRAADSSAKNEVFQAAQALGGKPNYSWRTLVTVPPDAQFRPGPTEGKTEKGGATHVKMIFNDNTTEAIIQGKGIAIAREGSGWQSAAELENEEGPARFWAASMKDYRAPAEQVQDILNEVKELKKDGDALTGELSEEGAKNLLRFRRGGGTGPMISNARGTARFWVKDALLTKYEYQVKGTVNFNGNDRNVDRTTTTEIKEIGTTKVSVPESAKKKLS